jgi:hypothetical protein
VPLERPITPAEDAAAAPVERALLVVDVSNANTHIDPQALELQDQQHRAPLERLVSVEHPAHDRRVGEVVVADDCTSRLPASDFVAKPASHELARLAHRLWSPLSSRPEKCLAG